MNPKIGPIENDSAYGKRWGFTSDKFTAGSYLYYLPKQKEVYISFIESKEKGKGHFSALLQAFEDDGLTIIVPNVFPGMSEILKKKGFEKHHEYSLSYKEEVDIWVKGVRKHDYPTNESPG